MSDERHSVQVFHPRAGSKCSGSNVMWYIWWNHRIRQKELVMRVERWRREERFWSRPTFQSGGEKSCCHESESTPVSPFPLLEMFDETREKKNIHLTFYAIQFRFCLRAIPYISSGAETNLSRKKKLICYQTACFHVIRLIVITGSFPQMHRWLR